MTDASVYELSRAGLRGESSMELRRMCRQLRRWQTERILGPEATESLRAVEDELVARGELAARGAELPS